MTKLPTDVEKFAAKIADKQDNPTIHELAKAFPNKTYRELEKYRDADRQQESDQTPLTEAQQNLVDHLTESQKKQEELEPIPKGVCLTGALRKAREKKYFKEIDWEMKYDTEHKLRQEAEGETTIVKGIGQNSPEMKAAKQKIEDLQNSLERFRKENSECYNRIADLTDSLESKDYFKDPDYKFLVNENHRLEQQYLEVMADNKKLARQVEDKMDKLRKSGL